MNAVPPNTANQNVQIRVGTNTTPKINSFIVRPLEIRAINVPTNGDQEIHHPQ